MQMQGGYWFLKIFGEQVVHWSAESWQVSHLGEQLVIYSMSVLSITFMNFPFFYSLH